MIIVKDEKYHYLSIFNPEDGTGIRSNVYEGNFSVTEIEPFMGSFPELLDIGVMGSCAHGKSGLCFQSGVECYQSGSLVQEPDMPLDKFKRLVDQAKGRTFQIALGGRGDPDMHPDFIAMIKYARENNIVPNFTTSGFGFKDELLDPIKTYCGAAAVSWYRNKYTFRALEKLINYGIRTNIHYCISNATIDEAIQMIEKRTYPEGVNRIIFLLHKPIGLGREENILDVSDERVQYFFSLFNKKENLDITGFDSCSVPGLINFTSKIDPMCIESCEAGRFSAYVSPDYKLYPCSFEQNPYFGVSLEDHSIEEAWNSPQFFEFRERFNNKCAGCLDYDLCFGGCPVVPDIVLCNRETKQLVASDDLIRKGRLCYEGKS